VDGPEDTELMGMFKLQETLRQHFVVRVPWGDLDLGWSIVDYKLI
jgi:hypothetical protein